MRRKKLKAIDHIELIEQLRYRLNLAVRRDDDRAVKAFQGAINAILREMDRNEWQRKALAAALIPFPEGNTTSVYHVVTPPGNTSDASEGL